jgi:AraC-like DNA-binding protein
MLFLALPADTVQAALNSRFTSVPPFETWATEFPLDTSAAAALASLCLWTAGELERPGSFLLSAPRAMASLERTVLAFFVEALEERYPGIDRATPDLAEKQVRMIEEWMDAHLTDIVGVEQLAAVVGTVPRSVQRTFRRLRGCTPMQAFLRRRLELAKRLLEDGILDRTVTDVATECGFFHLGRFSARYRALFGETPSATLARRRRRSTRA